VTKGDKRRQQKLVGTTALPKNGAQMGHGIRDQAAPVSSCPGMLFPCAAGFVRCLFVRIGIDRIGTAWIGGCSFRPILPGRQPGDGNDGDDQRDSAPDSEADPEPFGGGLPLSAATTRTITTVGFGGIIVIIGVILATTRTPADLNYQKITRVSSRTDGRTGPQDP
jgi:hypothetical protein